MWYHLGMKECVVCGKQIYKYSTRCKSCENSQRWKTHVFTRQSLNKGEKNPHWSGDKVEYSGVHTWVRRHNVKSEVCDLCGKKTTRLDLANKRGNYVRDIEEWNWLCRKCHMQSDGRLNSLRSFNIAKMIPRLEVICMECGKRFRQKRPRQSFCGKLCSNRHNIRISRK